MTSFALPFVVALLSGASPATPRANDAITARCEEASRPPQGALTPPDLVAELRISEASCLAASMNLVPQAGMAADQVSVKLGELKARATPSISILEDVATHGSPRVRMIANEHLGALYVAMAVRARTMFGGRTIVVGDALRDKVERGIAPWLADAHDLFASVERDAKRQPRIARSDAVIRNVVAAAEREFGAPASAVAVGQTKPPPVAARPVATGKPSARAIAHKRKHARKSATKAL